MSERRAKQVRRLLVMLGVNDPQAKRLSRMAASPELIGWQNTTREEYDAACRGRK